MDGNQERHLAFDKAREHFHSELARGRLLVLIFIFICWRFFALLRVLLRLDEFLAQHSDHLGASAGRFAGFRARSFTQRGGDHGERNDGRPFHVVIGRLRDHGLTGNQSSGAVTCVNGGDAESANIANQPIPAIIRVDGAKFRLDGSGLFQHVLILRLIQISGKPHGGVRVHESGRDHFGAEQFVTRRNRHLGSRADTLDLAAAHEDYAIVDGRAGHGVELVAAHR